MLREEASAPFAAGSFTDGYLFMLGGRHYEAYRVFSNLYTDWQANAALHFNMCMCLAQVCQYDAALQCIARAQEALPPAGIGSTAPPGGASAALFTAQAAGYAYFSPMPDAMPLLFPDECRLAVLRLQVDVLLAAGRWQEVLETAAPLRGQGYANIEAAVQEAETCLRATG